MSSDDIHPIPAPGGCCWRPRPRCWRPLEGFRQRLNKYPVECAPVRVPTLARPCRIVLLQLGVQALLRPLDGLVPLGAAHDREVVIEQCPMQVLDEAVALRTAHSSDAAHALLDLQHALIGMLNGAPLPAPPARRRRLRFLRLGSRRRG